MATPKVSVIVPNYNYARYLPERIESILNQTYQDVELILLDDASTDNSVDVLRQWVNHPKVSHFIVNEKNSGSPFAQWHKGIELARGEYIWIAEADDSALPEFLATTVAALDANPQAALAIVMSNLMDSEGRPSEHDAYEPFEATSEVFCYAADDYAANRMLEQNAVYNASMVLFRKSTYQKISDHTHLNMRSSGDWYLWVNMLNHGDIVEVRRTLNNFRLHATSTSQMAHRTGRQRFEDVLTKLNIIVSHRKKLGERLVETYAYRIMRNLRRGDYDFDCTWCDVHAEIEKKLSELGVKLSDYCCLWVRQHLRRIIKF